VIAMHDTNEPATHERRIRSFVLRQGRTTPAQQRAFDAHWSRYGLDFAGAPRDFAAAFGRAPDFVDGHQHVHLFPQIREETLAAVKRAAPAARVRQCGSTLPPRILLQDFKTLALSVLSRGFRRRAAALGLATNPAFAGVYGLDPDTDFAALFPRFLQGLPDNGLVMCHPGQVDAQLRRLDPLTDLRETEYRYFAGDSFLEFGKPQIGEKFIGA